MMTLRLTSAGKRHVVKWFQTIATTRQSDGLPCMPEPVDTGNVEWQTAMTADQHLIVWQCNRCDHCAMPECSQHVGCHCG